jgi:hypothetical protein
VDILGGLDRHDRGGEGDVERDYKEELANLLNSNCGIQCGDQGRAFVIPASA